MKKYRLSADVISTCGLTFWVIGDTQVTDDNVALNVDKWRILKFECLCVESVFQIQTGLKGRVLVNRAAICDEWVVNFSAAKFSVNTTTVQTKFPSVCPDHAKFDIGRALWKIPATVYYQVFYDQLSSLQTSWAKVA